MDVVGLDIVRERQAAPPDDALDVARGQASADDRAQPARRDLPDLQALLGGGAGPADAAGNGAGKAAVSGRSILECREHRRSRSRSKPSSTIRAARSAPSRTRAPARRASTPPLPSARRRAPDSAGRRATPGAPGQRRLRHRRACRCAASKSSITASRASGWSNSRKQSLKQAHAAASACTAGRSASATAAPCTPGQRGKDATPRRRWIRRPRRGTPARRARRPPQDHVRDRLESAQRPPP